MLRYLIFLAIIYPALTNSIDDLLAEIFGVLPESVEDNRGPFRKCDEVEGALNACYECYPCDNKEIKAHRNKGLPVETIHLNDANCNTTEICCEAQLDLLSFRSGGECGLTNPDGIPRKRRPKVRSVLQGEYPWRAWVYEKASNKLLCAATYIHENTKALLTSATCVDEYAPEDLSVVFTGNSKHPASVEDVIVHDKYDATNKNNDIAILILRSLESTPMWAKPACLPLAPPAHALPCVTMSAGDIQINTMIPLKQACTKGGNALHASQICAIAAHGDYPPQYGSGLFCLEENTLAPSYVVYGIQLKQENEAASTYTNVSHFTKWIENTLHL